MYRNHEGYADPTVGAVMQKLMTEYYRKKRAERRRAHRRKAREERLAREKDSRHSEDGNARKEE